MTSRNIAQISGNNRAFEPYSTLPVNSKGWYIDLDLPPSDIAEGERMVGDQQVIKNVLIAASILPSTANPCLIGRGYINAIDAFTGTSLQTGLFDINRDGTFGGTGDKIGSDAIGSIDLGIGMVTDPALLDKLLVAGGSGSSLAMLASTPLDPSLYGGRISWREIIRR
jgi:type IV pilus assembly protein PilY1